MAAAWAGGGAVMPNPFTKEDAMLSAPTLEQLQTRRLTAMAAAWTAQPQNAELSSLSFDERFALLVDAEWRARENSRDGGDAHEDHMTTGRVALKPVTEGGANRSGSGRRLNA